MTGRERRFARLGEGTFDLCVIGAGIVGSRIAYEAARDGLRVALVDAGDIGGATSAASSKLIHGGLRYFAQGHLDIARASLREKRALVRTVAPGLVRPMPIVVSVERRKWASALAMRGALAAYDALGGWGASRTRVIDDATARRLVPVLGGRPATSCILLDEAQVNDARLVLVTALAAADRGAVVVNHAHVTSLVTAAGEWRLAVRAAEGETTVRARSVVNATGPWVDALRRMADPAARPITRLSKGVHVVLPLDEPWGAGLSVHVDDEHNLFAVPWYGMLLVGVTDTPYAGDPAACRVTPFDIDLLISDSRRVLPDQLLRRDRIRAATAGLRVLPAGTGPTSTARREHVVEAAPSGLVSIGGGKLTTHRLDAMDALQALPAAVRPRRRAPSGDALVPAVADDPRRTAAHRAVDGDVLAHLLSLYGPAAHEVLASAQGDSTAFERIHPGGPDVWAQARYAVSHEYAVTVDDIALRRTTLGWRGLADLDTRDRLAHALAPGDVLV